MFHVAYRALILLSFLKPLNLHAAKPLLFMTLIEFYGQGCPHCIAMDALVEKLEHDLGVVVEKFEVWNSEENARKKEKFDNHLCGGVPFFYNTKTKAHLCGAVEYDVLKKWASD